MADQQYEMHFNLTAGPCKFDLMNALFAGDSSNPVTVKFTIQQRVSRDDCRGVGALQMIEVHIHSVEREDGSGQSWNITGYAKGANKYFRCYYSSTRRTGWFAYLKAS